MASVEKTVTDKITANKVLIVSKSYCPHCKRAKAVIKKYIDAKELDRNDYCEWEIDADCDGKTMERIQSYLKKLTGASSVPRVFINGKSLGGADDTVAADRSNKIRKMLAENPQK